MSDMPSRDPTVILAAPMKSVSYLRQFRVLLVRAAQNWDDDDASTTGAALAFYCAFSLAPLLVILLSIAGTVLGRKQAYDYIQSHVQWLFGPASATTVMGAVEAAGHTGGLVATLISIVTLLIGATTVFNALQNALNQIWQCTRSVPQGVRGFIRLHLLSFGFILALGFLMLVFLTLSTALADVRSEVTRNHLAVVSVMVLVDFGVSLAITGGLFALIYRYMPQRRTPWRAVLGGGLFTALLFDAGRWGISIYLSHSTQLSTFGAAASFAALLLWLYYTAQIFLFGAEFTVCLAGFRPVTYHQTQ